MYLPIFRGRQFELLALRELISENLLSKRVIPIVEPVKVSSSMIKTIDSFVQAERDLAIIRNPLVGSFVKDIANESNIDIRNALTKYLLEDHIVSVLYVDKNLDSNIMEMKEQGISLDRLILICNNPDSINDYEHVIGTKLTRYSLIPDKGDFRRRIRSNPILCEDHFPKQYRNADYSEIEEEFFSNDHLYYLEDGYKGFADYSVVGDDYSESGFAPYAVAIHIVYFDESNSLRIAHFVSDSNDDISDPARKFAEAAKKLVDWNAKMKLNTRGIKAIEEAYEKQTYPGLGVLKKCSIMHHLELISRFLDGEEE